VAEVDRVVAAYEALGVDSGSHVTDGAGSKGRGQGWFDYENGSTYPVAISRWFDERGYFGGEGVPVDPAGSRFMVYRCGDRVAVFSVSDGVAPTAEDAQWWSDNGCPQTPFDQRRTYFQLSAPVVPPDPPPTADPQPVGQSGWTLLFSDDFDSLDTSRWEPGWFVSGGYSPPVNNRGLACYDSNNVRVSGGNLELNLVATSDRDCRKKDGSPADFAGSLVNTRHSFNYSYGYVEARLYFPADGARLVNWPAFWQTGTDWPATGEVDIAEVLSTGQPCAVYHWEGAGGEHLQDKQCIDVAEPVGWHTFAAERSAGRITYYYDGVPVFEATEGVTGDDHFLILAHGYKENAALAVPAVMLVDYVRVWTRE
jgi:hypothetical protein